MEKFHTSILIHAPVQKVWHTMLDKRTYTEWTTPFSEGSYYEGAWEEGQEIRFLSSMDGVSGGMYSKVREVVPYQFLSIEHIGIIKNGEIDTTSEEVKKWTPAYENYTFTIWEEGTEVEVDMDLEKDHMAMFTKMWAEALNKLKTMCENQIF